MKSRLINRVQVFCPDRFSPILTLGEVSNAPFVNAIKTDICALQVAYPDLLDHLTDLNRDYRGRYFDPEAGFLDPDTGRFREVFVDMQPLEDARIEWWRDNFGPTAAVRDVVRVRGEASARWQAIGSIYLAWYPWKRAVWQMQATTANHNHAPLSR